jgi:[ribosomal protein S5]-alanine N-acetyltransferase
MKGPDRAVLRLRPLAPADYAGVFGWYNDPDLVSPYDRFAVDTLEEFVREVEAAPGDPASLAPRFAVERIPEHDVIGVVGHYRAHPVLEYVDVWYVLGVPAARGRGYGSEAVRLLIDEVFRTDAVERVGATCDVENAPSYRLLERLGLRREGTLRSALFHHARWHDVFVYGITRAEWAGRPRPA